MLGPLISSVVVAPSSLRLTGHDFLALRTEDVFQQRMPGLFENQGARSFGTQARDGAVELDGEFRFGEQQFQTTERRGGGPDLFCVRAEAAGEFTQQAVDLAKFFFFQMNQFIVEVNGFQRLDKHGGSAAAGSVDDAVDLALSSGDNRHNKAIVANGDEIFLQRAVFVMRAEETR